MAILLPFVLRYKKNPDANGVFKTVTMPLLTNPTDITIKKKAQIAEIRTLGGTVFQPWTNVPDEASIKGILYGMRAVLDFQTLHGIIDSRPDLKEIDLIYKWKTYPGYIKHLSITAAADKPRMFHYEFDFVSKVPFNMPKMMLGQLTNYRADTDYFRDSLYGLKNSIKADPITGVVSAAATVMAIGAEGLSDMKQMLTSPSTAMASVQSLITKEDDY